MYTHILKAEPEIHRCGEFDFVISELHTKPRISDLASLGNLIPAQRRRSLYALSFWQASWYPWKTTNVDHLR